MDARAGGVEVAGRPANRAARWQAPLEWLAPLLCFGFGALCLVLVVGPADGTWVLYAREMQAGHRLYSDLGVNQQPLFPLLSYAGAMLSPGGLLGDRLIFFGVIALHVLLIFLVSRRAAGPGLGGLILGLAAYFTAIHFEGFRYDDYHAVAHCVVLASLYLSIRLCAGELGSERFAFFQGALAGAAFLTRVNEGLGVGASVAIVVLSLHGTSRLTGRLVLIGALGAALVFALVMILIGETPATWFQQTVVTASAAKGGASLASAPWRALVQSVGLLLRPISLLLLLLPLLIAGALAAMRPANRRDAALLGGAAGLCIFAVLKFCDSDSLVPLAPVVLVLSVAGLAAWAIRWAKGRGGDASALALVAYPFFMFATGALSSGGRVYPLYFPVALALLVAALLLRRPFDDEQRAPLRIACLGLLALVAADAFAYRVKNPYSWLAYRVNPLFVDYRFQSDPAHGPHVVTRQLSDLITPVCSAATGKSLLSLPYSFANYYCGIPVWHGYVQSFFDTSTRSRIEQIEKELQQDPPDFVFYQRQLPILRFHEISFAGGRPLPHRDLDRLIAGKVRRGEWTIVYRSNAYPPSTWYLISTRKGAQ
jgi:hypothetical protein